MTRKTLRDLGEQLRGLSITPRERKYLIATLDFHNDGGSRDEALAVIDAVYMPVEAPLPPSPEPAVRVRSHRRRRHKDSVRMPGHAARGAAAIAAVQPTLAASLFDTFRLPDGRTLRDIRWCDAPVLAMRYGRIGRVIKACHDFAIPADETVTLDVVVPEAELARILRTTDQPDAVN